MSQWDIRKIRLMILKSEVVPLLEHFKYGTFLVTKVCVTNVTLVKKYFFSNNTKIDTTV